MGKTITADALEPGQYFLRNGEPVLCASVVHVMGELRVAYEKIAGVGPMGQRWHCTYLLGAPVTLIYTEAADEMPDVVEARKAADAAQAAAYADPDSDELWDAHSAALEALWAARQRYAPKTPCNCEHVRHSTSQVVPEHRGLPRDGHPEYVVPAGRQRAHWVGEICDTCASTCLADYLVKEA